MAAVPQSGITKSVAFGIVARVFDDGIDRVRIGMVKHIDETRVPIDVDALADLYVLPDLEIGGVSPCVAQAVACRSAPGSAKHAFRLQAIGNEANLILTDSVDVPSCVQRGEIEECTGWRAANVAPKIIAGVSCIHSDRSNRR